MEELKKISVLATIAVLCMSTPLFATCCGSALQFDGIDDYVEVPDDASLRFDEYDSFTISCWAFPDVGSGWLVCKMQPSTQSHCFTYEAAWNSSNSSFGFTISRANSSSWVPINTGDGSAPAGDWYHVTTVYDNRDMKIYLNGQLSNTGTFPYDTDGTSSNNLGIGARLIISQPVSGSFFEGTIDDVRIYDRALSAEDIQERMHKRPDTNDPNLVGYWDFDEGGGQVAQDSSGNNNDGQLGSGPGVEPDDPTWVDSYLPFAEYYVDYNAPNDPCHGVPGQVIGDANLSDPNEDGSIEHPFDSIQKAVNNAADCDMIVVLDGYYTGNGNYDIDPNGLVIRIKSQNGPDECLIDCNSEGRAFTFQSGEDECTVIDGFTIINGYVSQPGGGIIDNCGGAIYCANSSPTIKNCTIAGNYAAWSGGAIFCQDSNAQISNCTIIGNSCDASGGGLCCVGGSATIKNSLIAFNDGDFSGGASSIYDSNMSVINCTIADNLARHQIGTGGIYCWEGNSVINSSILWYNYSYDNNQIKLYDGNETVVVTYSDIQMPDINDPCWPGLGNIKAQPLFADYYFLDYHLKSAAGRWTPIFSTNGDFNNDGFIDLLDFAIFALYWQHTGTGQLADLEPDEDEVVNFKDLAVLVSNWLGAGENIPDWILDDETSPCIDAGDPVSDYSLEPAQNGGIINMGAYGNTQQASKSTN